MSVSVSATAAASRGSPAGLVTAIRFALRELRGGLHGFYVFIACIAIGVGAIAGVASVSRALTEGIAGEGRAILGGDLDFSLVHESGNAAQLSFLHDLGTVSTVATMRAMARTVSGNDQALVELKAIDNAYPLFGTLALSRGGALHRALARRDEAQGQTQGDTWGAVADPALMARLEVKTGDTITLGYARLTIVDTIANEPDKLSGGLELAPRLMISQGALDASKLVQPGSLVRWHHRVALSGVAQASRAAVTAAVEEAKARFPQAGWRIRTRENSAPGLQHSIRQFTQFLTLVGLTALVVGGVGVANAVRAFLDSKRTVIATFKCVGAPGGFVFKVYLVQILLLAGIGIALGLAFGAILPYAAGVALVDVLPVHVIAGLYPRELALGLVYGLLTALAFALWPLGRAHDVPPTALFRDELGSRARWPRKRYMTATAVTVLLLAGLAVALAYERRIAVIYVGAAAASFVLLFAVGRGLMALARRAPRFAARRRSSRFTALATEWRLAIGNIHRPGALTPSVTLSLGLGLTLLVALTLIDGNLRRELTTRIAGEAPSFFFLDIQNDQMPRFGNVLAREAPRATVVSAPMLRGRIVSLRGVAAGDIEPQADAAWVLRGDRGITYSATLPDNSKLVDGKWWAPDYAGEPLVSFEADLAKGLGLSIGDTITVNVLGRRITARIANTREVEWQTLALNFVMVFSPNTFAGAPHSNLATLTWDKPTGSDREIAVLKAVSQALPTVTGVRVKDAIEQVNSLVAQLAWAIRGASSITLVASVLVLAGALAAGHRGRIHDAVILKTLGATRARLIVAYSMEYAVLGLASALFAVVAGTLAGWFVVVKIMDAHFQFQPFTALAAALIALVLSVGFGLIGTWRVLGHRPAAVLRNL